MNTVKLRYDGREEELLVPSGLPRQELLDIVRDVLGLSADARLSFRSEGRHVAFSSYLPDQSVVDVLVGSPDSGAHCSHGVEEDSRACADFNAHVMLLCAR
jgi:hypothetical protein